MPNLPRVDPPPEPLPHDLTGYTLEQVMQHVMTNTIHLVRLDGHLRELDNIAESPNATPDWNTARASLVTRVTGWRDRLRREIADVTVRFRDQRIQLLPGGPSQNGVHQNEAHDHEAHAHQD